MNADSEALLRALVEAHAGRFSDDGWRDFYARRGMQVRGQPVRWRSGNLYERQLAALEPLIAEREEAARASSGIKIVRKEPPPLDLSDLEAEQAEIEKYIAEREEAARREEREAIMQLLTAMADELALLEADADAEGDGDSALTFSARADEMRHALDAIRARGEP